MTRDHSSKRPTNACPDRPGPGKSSGKGPVCTGDQRVIRFCTTKNRMRAGVSWYDRDADDGPLTVERLRVYLEAAGLCGEVDLANADIIVRRLNKGQPVDTLVLLRGVQPQRAHPGRLDAALDTACPVVPGMLVGQALPPEPPRPGRDVLGKEVPPPQGFSAEPLAVSEHDFDEDDRGMLTAKVYGMVRLESGRLWLDSPMHLSEDGSEARIDVYARNAQGTDVTMDRLLRFLEYVGVVEGVQVKEMERALAKARKSGQMQPLVLAARGRPVRHGRNGSLALLGESTGDVCQVLDAEGLPDGPAMFSKVRKGQEIGRIMPPGQGEPGLSVYGRPIPARPGKPLSLKAGKGVRLDKETGAFLAKEAGLVVVEKGLVSLSDLMVIRRSLVAHIGHVKPKEASVRVEGTVAGGARITVRKSLQALEAVEDAWINAGGAVQVAGGVIMSGRGRIRAGGTVSAAFMNNARVWSGEDVVAAKYIVCTEPGAGLVQARGRVVVTGSRGLIHGGRVVARRGIQVWSVGSALGVETVLSLSLHNVVIERLNQMRAKLEQGIDKACSDLLTDREGLPEIIARFEDSMNERLQQTALRVRLLQRQLDKVQDRLSRETAKDMQELAGSSIVVRGRAYPGTVIEMSGRRLVLDKPVDRSRFQWDPETRSIRVGML